MPIQSNIDLAKLRELVEAMPASRLAAYISQLCLRLITLLNGNGGTTTVPGIPGSFAVTGGAEQAVVTWTAPSDAFSYEVWRAPSDTQVYTRIRQTPALAIRDTGLTAGSTFCYKVRAMSIDAIPGDFTNPICVAITSAGGPAAPSTPADLLATPSGPDSIALEWEELTGTGVAVEIARKTTVGGTYATIDSGITGTEYTDLGLTENTTYYYKIRAVNAAGDLSAYSNESSATTTFSDTTAPPVPSIKLLTTQDRSIKIKLNGVTATDLAGYEVGRGTSPGGPYTVVAAGPDTVFVDAGLTNGTIYYYVARSYDTSENRSAWSAELNKQPAVEIDLGAPDTPTEFRGTSPAARAITLRWSRNTETDLASYVIYSDEADPGGAFALVQTLTPAQLTWVRTGLSSEFETTPIRFKIAAKDLTGNQSAFSETISLAADGGDGSDPDPGGGTQTISGDTGLGAAHKAPGATFDYVIDVSGYTGPENSMRVGMAQLKAMIQSQQVVLTGTRKRIAVLLPARTENAAVELRTDNGYVPGVNGQAIIFPLDATYDVDFIGPWVGGANFLAAQKLVSGVNDDLSLVALGSCTLPTYRITARYEGPVAGTPIYAGLTNCGVSGSVLSERTRLFNNPVAWDGNVRFWCIRVSGGGQQTVAFGDNDSPNGNLIDFNLCRFDHDDTIWDNSVKVVNSQGQLSQVTADFPRWGFSAYGARMSFRGCLMDFPWNTEHAVYDRNSPYGDREWDYVRVERCGGQVYQQVHRRGEGPLINYPNADPGTTTMTHVVSLGYNRNSSWSSAVVTKYAAHSLLDMSNCLFMDIDASNGITQNQWPNEDPLAPLTGYGVYETFGGFQAGANPEGSAYNQGNYQVTGGTTINGGVKMRDCYFYSRAADKALLGMQVLDSIDIEDCGFFTGPTNVTLAGYNNGGQRSQSRIEIGELGYKPSAQETDTLVGSCNFANNNTPTIRTFVETYTGLSGADVVNPTLRIKGDTVGTGASSVTFTNLRVSGGAPGDLVVS